MYVVVLALLASYAVCMCRPLFCFRFVRLLAFVVRAGRVPPRVPAVGSLSFVVAPFQKATFRSLLLLVH